MIGVFYNEYCTNQIMIGEVNSKNVINISMESLDDECSDDVVYGVPLDKEETNELIELLQKRLKDFE